MRGGRSRPGSGDRPGDPADHAQRGRPSRRDYIADYDLDEEEDDARIGEADDEDEEDDGLAE